MLNVAMGDKNNNDLAWKTIAQLFPNIQSFLLYLTHVYKIRFFDNIIQSEYDNSPPFSSVQLHHWSHSLQKLTTEGVLPQLQSCYLLEELTIEYWEQHDDVIQKITSN